MDVGLTKTIWAMVEGEITMAQVKTVVIERDDVRVTRRAPSAPGESLIRLPIAVVVEPIARLDRRGAGEAGPRAGMRGLGAARRVGRLSYACPGPARSMASSSAQSEAGVLQAPERDSSAV